MNTVEERTDYSGLSQMGAAPPVLAGITTVTQAKNTGSLEKNDRPLLKPFTLPILARLRPTVVV